MKHQNLVYVLLGIGAISFLFWLFFTYQSVRKSVQWEEAPGKITQLNATGYPTISFSYNGVPHEFHENSSSSDMYTGQEVKVYFSSWRTQQGRTKIFFQFMVLTSVLWNFLALIWGRQFNNIVPSNKSEPDETRACSYR